MSIGDTGNTLKSIIGLAPKRTLGDVLGDAAAAWQTYEQGMDWEPSYLANMGNLDMDTTEFEGVVAAMGELDGMLEAQAETADAGQVRQAQAVLDAYQGFRSVDWGEPDGEIERRARAVSAALGIDFAGRQGDRSTNTPL